MKRQKVTEIEEEKDKHQGTVMETERPDVSPPIVYLILISRAALFQTLAQTAHTQTL